MKTVDIIGEANGLSDETETNGTVLSFLNQAMAKINVHMNAGFPYLTLNTDDKPVFSEKWQRILLIPFAVGRIKQKDSSQFEYSDAYSEFLASLADFKAKYTVPDIYRSLVSGNTIILADNTNYVVKEDDTLTSIAVDKTMVAADIMAKNLKLYYVTDGISSDIYDTPPYPWLTYF